MNSFRLDHFSIINNKQQPPAYTKIEKVADGKQQIYFTWPYIRVVVLWIGEIPLIKTSPLVLSNPHTFNKRFAKCMSLPIVLTK